MVLGPPNRMRREIGLVRAWLLVDSLNRSFRAPVIASQKGGQHGGGAFLTEFGQAVVQHFAWQTVMTTAAHQIVTGAYAMLYREMDRAQLDAAYNNSAAVPERDAIVADWAARSARVRREYVGRLELAYGDTPRERLDLFLAADPKAPTLAFIHGGYWQMNDKESFAFFAEGLLPLGINLAVIEYTLAPAARLDRIVAEVRRSVRWLAEHLGEHGADANRLYVAGHSAGGHLTAMTMPLAEVRGGIAISGIYDLEPIRLNYLNEKLGLDAAEAERNSPLRHLPTTAGELVVAYGTRELPELCRQSIEYGREGTERGLSGRLLPVDELTTSRYWMRWPDRRAL
jgi:arylformamidase